MSRLYTHPATMRSQIQLDIDLTRPQTVRWLRAAAERAVSVAEAARGELF